MPMFFLVSSSISEPYPVRSIIGISNLIDLSAFPTRDTKKELEEMNKFLEEWLRKKHDKELIEEWD